MLVNVKCKCSLIAFDETVMLIFSFFVHFHTLVRVRMLLCLSVSLRITITQAHANNVANTHAQGSAWPGTLKSKYYSLVEGNRTIIKDIPESLEF